jgi:hypothetical protein
MPFVKPDGSIGMLDMDTGQVSDTQVPAGSTLGKSSKPLSLPEYKDIPKTWEGAPDKPPPQLGIRQDIWDMTMNLVRTGQRPPTGWGSTQQLLEVQRTIPVVAQALGVPSSRLADLQAQFYGERHGMIVGAGRVYTLNAAVNEAEQFAPAAKEASHRVDRTQYPTLNKVYEAYLSGTGDPDIVELVNWTNAFVNVAAQIASRTGAPTNQARDQAYKRLNDDFSAGQFDRALDVTILEGYRAKYGASNAIGEVMNTFVPPALRHEEKPPPDIHRGPPTSPPRPPGVPENSMWSPSTGWWRDPDGKVYDAKGKPVHQ